MIGNESQNRHAIDEAIHTPSGRDCDFDAPLHRHLRLIDPEPCWRDRSGAETEARWGPFGITRPKRGLDTEKKLNRR